MTISAYRLHERPPSPPKNGAFMTAGKRPAPILTSLRPPEVEPDADVVDAVRAGYAAALAEGGDPWSALQASASSALGRRVGIAEVRAAAGRIMVGRGA